MATFNLVAYFEKGFIAEPYWPEMYKLINIQKESGMNRARSAANRRKALEEHLSGIGMSLVDYEKLELAAKRPFHTLPDGEIIIPELNVFAFLVATTNTMRAASRPCPPEQIRALINVTAWKTGVTQHSGVWERFVTVTAGAGNKLSNQRGMRESHYIADFEAAGSMTVNPEFVDPKTLEKAIKYGGENVGIGSSRKMGWGRFELRAFEEAPG